MNRYAFAQSTRDYVTDYIKFGDSKAGAVLALAVVVAGVLGALAEKLTTALASVPAWLWLLSMSVALVVVVATAMVVLRCVDALRPNIALAERSLASFPDIARDPAEYLARCAVLHESGIAIEYEKHVAQLASVAQAKFDAIARAVWWLQAQILATYALVAIYAVLKLLQPVEKLP